MRGRRGLLILLAACLGMLWACSGKRQAISDDMKKEIAALRTEKILIDEKIRDLENARAVLEQRNRDDLEGMRRQIESIQNALGKIQSRFDAMDTVAPSSPPEQKRLSPYVAIPLAVVAVFSVVIAVKLHSMRARQKKVTITQEAPVDTTTLQPPPPKPPTS